MTPQWLKDFLQALPPPTRGPLGEFVQTTASVHTYLQFQAMTWAEVWAAPLAFVQNVPFPRPWDVWVSTWLLHKPCTG